MEKKYLIIGGVAAGASAATRLRRLDEKASIIMFDKGDYVSFSNCSLPYRISEIVDTDDKLVLMSPDKFFSQYRIDARVKSEVVKIDEANKQVVVKNLKTDEIYTEYYDKLVVTPGAKAIIPRFEGFNKIPTFALKTVNDTTSLMNYIYDNAPENIVVIGGGFIGVETAENLVKRNINVTLVDSGKQIVKAFDLEMSLYAKSELERKGVNIVLNNPVEGFDEGKVILKGCEQIKADAVVLAIGITPETDFLKDTKIALNNHGYIKVNADYQTTSSDIYAAGDAINVHNSLGNYDTPLTLAGSANKQGRLIADHINGRTVLNKGYIGSSIIKVFDLTLAKTGLSETEIKQMEKPYDYMVTYAAPTNKVSIMPDSSPIFMKVLFEKNTGLVLGAQAISKEGADKRIDVIATAIKFKATVFDLADLELAYAPMFSTGKDPVNKVGYQASELVLGAFNKVNFTDVYNLVDTKEQIIDVRELEEYNNGHITGSINIPMSEFRERLDEIDINRKVYVHCQTGQRSYNVTRALSQLGYDAYNIAGSYLFTKNYEIAMCKMDNQRKNILN